LEAQNSRYPQPNYQQQETKNAFSGLSSLQEARRAKLQPLEDPFKRSWNDGQKFMGSNLTVILVLAFEISNPLA